MPKFCHMIDSDERCQIGHRAPRAVQLFRFVAAFLGSFLAVTCLVAQPLKVACVGDSVTFGLHIENREADAYPAQLQRMLGGRYQVENFGASGATLLRKGHHPYFLTDEFKAALSSHPDIVVIHLGLNDTDPRDWPDYRDDFRSDYSWLIGQFRRANPSVQVYVAILTPIFASHPRFKSGTRAWAQQIRDEIPQIARANDAHLIDFYAPLISHPNYFPDALHPNANGAAILARTVYRALTGDFGGLQLPEGFGDHMVLPWGQPLKLSGRANRDELVDVTLGGIRRSARANDEGWWSVTLPPQRPGGPFKLLFHAGGKSLALSDVLFGELWLCSGQSNMDFPVSKSSDASAALGLDDKMPIRLLHYKSAAQTDESAWSAETLSKVNDLKFFSGAWEKLSPDTVSSFSAVGYFFALRLYQRLHIPVGMVQVAVGGSNAESWIDRRTLQDDPRLVDILVNWRNSDFIMPWCLERVAQNLKNSTDPLQRHPFEPAYNFEAGIAPLQHLPFRGVIWYQGESNTHNPELYSVLFPAMVKSWRELWGRDLPFFYVQLSGMNRPSWPRFRDEQRRLADLVPDSGMVVSSDLGESEQVHYLHKKPVGDRLADLTLEKVYRVPGTHGQSPVGFSATRKGTHLEVEFKNTYGQLKTSDGQHVRGFELRDGQGNWHAATTYIDGNRIRIQNPNMENMDAVAYAWQPLPDANLVNAYDLPASTFILEISRRSLGQGAF